MNTHGHPVPTAKPSFLPLVLAGAVAAALGLSAPAMGGGAGPPAIRISEIRIDQPGEDNDEYIELVGPPNTSLTGLHYIVVGDGVGAGGNSGTIEATVNLTGRSTSQLGRFVIGDVNYDLSSPDLRAALNFENSRTVTHMLIWNATGSVGSSIDPNEDGFVDTARWEQTVDVIAIVDPDDPVTHAYGPGTGGTCTAGTHCNEIVIQATDPGHFFRCSDGGSWREGDFDPASALAHDTPGTLNPCPPPPSLFANGFE